MLRVAIESEPSLERSEYRDGWIKITERKQQPAKLPQAGAVTGERGNEGGI